MSRGDEVSRSSQGPKGGTPYVPPWVCDLGRAVLGPGGKDLIVTAHELASGDVCRFCWMPRERWTPRPGGPA